MKKTNKLIRVTDCGTWELAREIAFKQKISMSEFVMRALFNEVHDHLSGRIPPPNEPTSSSPAPQ